MWNTESNSSGRHYSFNKITYLGTFNMLGVYAALGTEAPTL